MAPRFRRVLLATEHGEYDAGAEALAFEFARRFALPLTAVLPQISNPEFEAVAPQEAERADAAAAARRAELQHASQAARVELQVRVRHGLELDAEIVDEAREHAADLIVIRRRGKRGLLANLLVGEMVSKVVAHAPCSVLIVPRGARLWSRRVIVGIDPALPDSTVLAAACAVARDSALSLRVVCVGSGEAARTSAESALEDLLRQAREQGVSVDGEVRTGQVEEELVSAARTADADLLVVGRDRGTTIARVWSGSTTQRIAGLSRSPVLVYVNASSSASESP